MTFSRIFRLSSSMLVLVGFFTIWITGGYGPEVLTGMTITAIYGVLGERLPAALRIPRWVWNALAIFLVLYLAYDTFFGDLDLVGNSIQFVIYLQMVKLLSPKTNRDHLQIFLLSFMHVLASTVLSSEIGFALPFLLYIVLATWALVILNLKVQQEKAARPDRRDAIVRSLLRSKDIITGRFLGFTSFLSVIIIAFTLLVFFLFPRFSMRQFFRRTTTLQRVSGFSENEELGTIGNIKTNETVVMRVELAEKSMGDLPIDRLHWRGTAKDRFDGRRWLKSQIGRDRIRIDQESGILTLHKRRILEGRPFRYRVFLEALSTPIIFGADRLYRVTWDKPFVERYFRGALVVEEDRYFGIYFLAADNYVGDLTYTAESILPEPTEKSLIEDNEDYAVNTFASYLQLPKLHPEVEAFLKAMPVKGKSHFERAQSIQSFIENNYRYTLEVQDAGTADPLHFFFLEKKAGHCEYFSTALVIALRYHGIPARQTIGFRGGELNAYGNYLAVRESDAHSWAEVYFPRSGWITFDPSPLDSTVRTKGFRFEKMNQFFDFVRLRWNKYIVEYDLRSQASILEKLGRQVASLSEQNKSKRDDGKEAGGFRKRITLPSLLGVFMALLLGLAIYFRFSRGRLGRSRESAHLNEILQILGKHGYTREVHQTPLEVAYEVRRKEGELPSLFRAISLYYDERYGRAVISDDEWKSAMARLREDLEARRQKPRRAA